MAAAPPTIDQLQQTLEAMDCTTKPSMNTVSQKDEMQENIPNPNEDVKVNDIDANIHPNQPLFYNHNNHNNNGHNSLNNELYKVFLSTRPSAQQTKNRNDLVQFITDCVTEQIQEGSQVECTTVSSNAVLFGSSALGIDINGIPIASDADYGITIPNKTHSEQITMLKNLKTRLSKTQITPDFYNQYTNTTHYNNDLVSVAEHKKHMRECNKNRARLIGDRKMHAKNAHAHMGYQGGPYSLKIRTSFKPNKVYLMSMIGILDPCYDVKMDLCVVSVQKRDQLRWTVKLMNYLLNYNFDERIRPFLVNIKYWCKMRGIHSAFDGCMNSYCYVLMGIKYLQMVQPPVLPVVTNGRDVSKVEFTGHKLNKLNVAQLLAGYFSFWMGCDFLKYDIDICKHGLVPRSQCLTLTAPLVIVDPVDCNHNCSSAVRKKGMMRILNEWYRATQLLSQNESWIDCVCVPGND